ncbi:hypothetical protein HQ590_16570 [bacterium]|nr:hypothetical protein [bacterium]
MHTQRAGVRAAYRQEQDRRVRESVSLAKRYRKLKSLTVDLEHCDPEGVLRGTRIKYQVNLANARSVFRFPCPNQECIRGDFDLTDKLAAAVKTRRRALSGSLSCPGWRNKITINKVRCQQVLRYRFTLGY